MGPPNLGLPSLQNYELNKHFFYSLPILWHVVMAIKKKKTNVDFNT